MRKFSLFSAFTILCLFVAVAITWTNRENILAHFMERQLRVPVSIRSLDIRTSSAEITRMWVGNFPHSQTSTSLAAESLLLQTKLDQFFANPVAIEEIDIDNVFVGIEFYDEKGEDSNWSRILQKNQKKGKPRDYLIRTLVLNNVTVETTEADGKVKRYPAIKQMEFHNITSESGFPIDEIEKAIFDLMMQDIFKKLQIEQIFRRFDMPVYHP